MEQPLVSVITVTRNRANLIGRCINSIQNQTYENIEHIIVDGASTDNTEIVVASYNDARIRYYKRKKEDAGQLECFDFALDTAKGKYVCFLDDDDEYLPTKIEKQVTLIEALPDEYGMVYCWMTYYDSQTGKAIRLHNPQLKGDVSEDVVEVPKVSGTPIFLFKTNAFNETGRFVKPEESGVSADWATGARFCQHYKVDYVPESLIKVYVNHEYTQMTDTNKYYSEADEKLIKFHLYFLNTYTDIFKKYPERGWYHYSGLLQHYLRVGNYIGAWKFYMKLIRYKPTVSNIGIPFKFFARKMISRK